MEEIGALRQPQARGRYSPETQAHLHGCLDIILDRAPSTVVKKVEADLTRLAGRFGEER